MSDLPRPLIAAARAQCGLLTVDQLATHSIRGRSRQRLLDDGVLVPLQRGIYRLATHAESFEQSCLAARLAAPDAVISGLTAGRLYGLRKCFTDDVHIIARRAIDLPGVVAHRTDFLRDRDVTDLQGLLVLRPARLVCDLSSSLSDADLESVVEQVIDRDMASMPLIRSVARQFAASGRNGTRRLVRVLDSRPTWIRPADSDLEVRVDRALRAQGIVLVRQFRVELDGGAVAFLDLADPELRLGVEIDHVTWHGGRLDSQNDKARDRALTRLGWTVVRVTDADVRVRLQRTVAEVVEIVHRLRRTSAA